MTLPRLITCIGTATFAIGVAAAPPEDYPPAYAPVVAEVRQRQDLAQKALAEWKGRAAALAAEQQKAMKEMSLLAGKLDAEGDPAVVAARQRTAAAKAAIIASKDALAAAKPRAFLSLAAMAEYDRLTDALVAATKDIDAATSAEAAAIRAFVRRDQVGAKLADAWDVREVDRIAAANEAIIVQMRRDSVVRGEGSVLDVIRPRTPRPPAPADGAYEVVRVDPPADAAARAAAFERRTSPATIDELGRRFFSQMTLTLPGLEATRGHADAGRYAEAFDAYKQYFFARLLQKPQGEAANAGGDDDGDSEGHSYRANMIFPPPTPAEIDDAFAGVVRRSFPIKGGVKHLKASLGTPGQMRWVFVTAQSLQDHPDAVTLLEFCRGLGFPGGTGAALLHSYAVGGPVEHLRAWSSISDDWAMNWQRDVERSPLPIRDYHLLYVSRIEEIRGKLRHIAMMRPEFVRDLPGTTLARLLMAMNEEYLASAVRLGRSGLYNFRIMAHESMVPTSLQMQEFHAHQWALREAWRQVHNNFVYKIRRDGANFEFANDGHENTDQFLHTTYRQFRQAVGDQPSWLEPFWDREFLDLLAGNARYRLHNLRPDGWCYRLSVRNQKERYLGIDPEYRVDLLADEPEVARRLWKVFGIGKPEPEPKVRSESLAFQGYYYLRDGWNPADNFVYFQAINQPILSGREEAMGFGLYGQGFAHLLSPPITVDGRVQYLHSKLIHDPGGKAPHAAYGYPDVVKSARFLSDDRFDLVEGSFNGSYDFHRPKTEIDVFGSYGYESMLSRLQTQAQKTGKPVVTEPVNDVLHDRMLIAVRGRGTYLVTDFVTSANARSFTQHYTMFAPVRFDDMKARLALLKKEGVEPVTLDAKARTVATWNIGLPNLRLRHITDLPIDYKLSRETRRDSVLAGAADGPAALKGFPKVDRQHSDLAKAAHFGQQLAVNFSGRGEMAMVTIVSPQDKAYSPAGPAEDLRDVTPMSLGADAAGFTAKYPDGTPIGYAAAMSARPLKVVGVTATARALLVVGGEGIALDCAQIAADGKPAITPPNADFRFQVHGGAVSLGQPVHRPIQPVVIEPSQNTFIEAISVALRCPTPGVQIRYTLDGSRPTPASPLYEKQIRLTETCRLQARAFRVGVTEDVWQQDGTHATVVSDAVFRKESPLPPAAEVATEPGLKYEYFEGIWTELMVRSLTMPAAKSGTTSRLFDVSARQTDGAFGVRYDGFIEVPADGVYTFHAPREYMFPDVDCGYDLRVFVAGREWYPSDRWRNHGQWSIALQAGKHPFKVVFTDLRPRPHKVELMWGFPHPEFTWKGVAPKLELSGPGRERRAIEDGMLARKK